MSPNKPGKIYLDNQATTAVDLRVMEVMLPWFTEKFGNAASRSHHFGWEAEEVVDIAREQTAAIICALPQEIIFTSGATESNNLALKGSVESSQKLKKHIISVSTEHKSVIDPLHSINGKNCTITFLGVKKDGLVDLEKLKSAITEDTILVSVMHANNEIGVIQPIEQIGRICTENGILFHTDAAQSVGKIPIDVEKMHIDLLSISSHKIYGPKGVGALYVRRKNPRVLLQPQIDGGGHERGLRSGTLPVPLIVGIGKTCEIAQSVMNKEAAMLSELRDMLLTGITESLDGITINGSMDNRLPGNINVSFEGVNGTALLMGLSTIAVSSGSACTSASPEPSYVLKALGRSKEEAHASIRFGIGRFNTKDDIQSAIDAVIHTVKRLRKDSPGKKIGELTGEKITELQH